MAPKPLVIPPEKIAEGRFLYEQTLMPLEDIAAAMGISRATLSKRLNGWGWKKRYYDPHARSRAKLRNQQPEPTFRAYPREDSDRVELIKRMQNAVDQQLSVIEAITASGQTKSQAERTTRMFASLSRTLREMTRLDVPPPAPQEAPEEPPRDLDELRRELSRKLAALVAGRAGAVPSES